MDFLHRHISRARSFHGNEADVSLDAASDVRAAEWGVNWHPHHEEPHFTAVQAHPLLVKAVPEVSLFEASNIPLSAF